MARQEKHLSFTFVNPNDRNTFERQFRRILIEKLLSLHGASVVTVR